MNVIHLHMDQCIPPLNKKEYMDKLKNPPKSMLIVMTLALFVASVYLYRAMLEVDEIILTKSMTDITLYFILMIILLGLYFRYLIAAFWLLSQNRSAWGSIVRLSGIYILLSGLSMLISFSVFDLDMNVGPISIRPTMMMVIMMIVILYMFTPYVRKMFTPSYSEEKNIKEWILLVFFIDPFSKNKMSFKYRDRSN
ncbi:MAG: hypothetical protein RBR05_06040 [Candidatus Methanomethylophilaceae archaeon]|nr:hypothetical protein [Candidatus Methanomethylophilaceae archaeon]MDY0224933.1 hypothetical protein [Candidatus Methanomethylophilaceae archaeon]